MATSDDIATLNSLTTTTIDSVKGFEEAAEDSNAGRYGPMFREFATERREAAAMLQEQVRRLGGDPSDTGSVAGAAHRAFLDFRQMFSARDDKAIVEEVERGEDYIKEKYQTALSSANLEPESRAIVERAYQSVRAGHDRVSALKHQLSA
ncbi:MAG: PA2169 family four-helix-bundle protein [Pseudomonadota bacterium]